MKINYRIIVSLTFILLLLFNSCVDEFWPELDNIDERLLVVEGKISNDPGPYTIKLSTSRSLDSIPTSTSSSFDFDPVKNAIVSIVDDAANTVALSEVNDGIYKTPDSFQGVVGSSYKLVIETPNGNNYESEFEEIKTPVGVESVDWQQVGEDEGEDSGFQFFVTSASNPGVDSYFQWQVIETHEYDTPYEPTHFFNGFFTNAQWDLFGNLITPGDPGGPFHNTLDISWAPVEISKCWRTDTSVVNYISTTQFSTSDKVSDFPLNFVPFQDIRLRIKYSLLVKQQTISENAYRFLKEVEELNSNDETDLYTKQPYQIQGNIRNINDSDEPVLGLFYAAGISEHRIFGPPDPNPQELIPYSLGYCKGIPSVYYDQGSPVNNTAEYLENAVDRPGLWPIYLGEAYIFTSDGTANNGIKWFVAYSRYCIDCRSKGGVLEKPDYWE